LLYVPRIEEKDIAREADAIRKICANGAHLHIVAVLKLGKLRDTPYHFIDMELCDLNLEKYIYRPTPPNPLESVPYFIKTASPPLKAQQIWNVMMQIASGVKYLHTLKMVHRDLKPANGELSPVTN
jgi:serine/threonine protein kinase